MTVYFSILQNFKSEKTVSLISMQKGEMELAAYSI